MPMLERYILRTSFAAFSLCLLSLTGVIWVSQALRELDLVTGKGQTILIFLHVTLLSLPALIMVIAPLALFISILYTLNRLNGDSELIVMSAAGVPPLRIFRPFAILTFLVAMLVGYITLIGMPESFRSLRDLITKIRADVITKIVQEGKFINLDAGMTFHYREKAGADVLLGMMVQDRRSANLVTTYLAERGQVVTLEGTPYMILENGTMQRQNAQGKENAIVNFDRYALDMDQFSKAGEAVFFKPRERTTAELFTLDYNDPIVQLQAGRFRAELHERFVNIIYPFATLMIAFAALGSARTTRQGRGGALAGAGLAVLVLRIAGFAASSLSVRYTMGYLAVYAVPILAIILGTLVIFMQQTGRRMPFQMPDPMELWQKLVHFVKHFNEPKLVKRRRV